MSYVYPYEYNNNVNNSKNIKNSQSCYYQNLNGYTNSKFGQVRFQPPLSDAIVYKDVFYAPPNYQTLTHKPSTENVNYYYPSINNAYDPCQSCNYSVINKCPNNSYTCLK